jgi:hypothetical protein
MEMEQEELVSNTVQTLSSMLSMAMVALGVVHIIIRSHR